MSITDETAVGRSLIDEGHGDPVVLIHSSAGSNRQWRALAQQLAPRYRVLAPNLCGYDGAAGGQYKFADDCERAGNVLNVAASPVHLVGHSYGGLVAIRIALDDPGRIRSLTLIEPVCFHLLQQAAETAAFEEILAVRDRQITAVGRGDLLAAAESFIGYWMGPDAWPAMPDDRRAAIAATMPKVAAEWPGAFSATTLYIPYTI